MRVTASWTLCANWGDFMSKCVIPRFQPLTDCVSCETCALTPRIRRVWFLWLLFLCFFLFFVFLFCAVGSVRIGAHEPLSFRATFADGWNRMSTCCEPYGGGSVPELSNDCAQPSVSGVTRLIHQTNNSGSLTFFSHAKLLLLSADGSAVLFFFYFFFFQIVPNLSHGFGEFNNNKKWRLSRCPVWSCCVIKNIHVNTGD